MITSAGIDMGKEEIMGGRPGAVLYEWYGLLDAFWVSFPFALPPVYGWVVVILMLRKTRILVKDSKQPK